MQGGDRQSATVEPPTPIDDNGSSGTSKGHPPDTLPDPVASPTTAGKTQTPTGLYARSHHTTSAVAPHSTYTAGFRPAPPRQTRLPTAPTSAPRNAPTNAPTRVVTNTAVAVATTRPQRAQLTNPPCLWVCFTLHQNDENVTFLWNKALVVMSDVHEGHVEGRATKEYTAQMPYRTLNGAGSFHESAHVGV